MTNQTLATMSPNDPALIAVAQSQRTTVDEIWEATYTQLEAEASDTVANGMVWEARIDWDDMGTAGYVLATKSFGTLLGALHARGFLTGDRPDDERLASVRRVAARY